jgi:hypothetical protein
MCREGESRNPKREMTHCSSAWKKPVAAYNARLGTIDITSVGGSYTQQSCAVGRH